MRRFLIPFAFFLLFALVSPFPAAAQDSESGEIHITRDGTVSIKGAKVFQKAGANFFARVYWKDVFLRVTVTTNEGTTITKRYGERATAADIMEGDVIDVDGAFPSSSETFIVQASSVKDHSLQKESLSVKGTVTVPFPDRDEFQMRTSRGTLITVTASGAAMKKGIIPITVAKLAAGDVVTHASGIYDFSTKVLAASKIDIYQTLSVFVPRNFQGTLKSVSGTSFPVELIVAIGGKDYSVLVTGAAKLQNKNRGATTLSRFLAGDTVRFYGSVRRDNLERIEGVEVLRNLNL
ncbi:MAG: hypothetical protein Q8Q36_03195 [bacterium]|nr:hypothetical protein [bacterium]